MGSFINGATTFKGGWGRKGLVVGRVGSRGLMGGVGGGVLS